MSDSEEDPRFRIPRGESDEEIDSDCASITSDVPQSRKAEPNSPNRSPSPSVSSDGAEGVLLSEIINQTVPSLKGSITKTAKLLSSVRPNADDEEDVTQRPACLDSDDGSSDEDEDAEALSKVTFAATRRKDLDKGRLRDARIVEPIVGQEGTNAAPVTESVSQKDMMNRMLHILGQGGDEEKRAGLAALEKKVKRVHGKGKKALSVPLSSQAQGRIERAAAYGKAKEEITEKWGGIVQKNRKAKQLVFPLNGPGTFIGRNTGDIIGGFKAENEFEEEIEELLKEAGVSNCHEVINGEDKGIDELGYGKTTKEEVLKRRHELAKVRSLMFDYERKMKRIKKIKSKKYRRVMKKEKEKIAQMGGSDGEEDDKITKAERRRAEERMTLRHKNTSKWVRRQLTRGEAKRNPDTKEAIEEQLRLHEELKRRQEGEIDGYEESGSDGEDDAGYVERLEDELQQIGDELQDEQKEMDARDKKKRSGVMGMRFMQQAQERERKEVLSLLNQIGKNDGDEEDGDSEDGRENKGRLSFAGAGTVVGDGRKDKEEEEEGFDDGGDSDSESQRLEKRIRQEYDESERRGEVGGSSMSKDEMDSVKNAVRKGSEIEGGFTSILKGRLTAGESVEKVGVEKAVVKKVGFEQTAERKGKVKQKANKTVGGEKEVDKKLVVEKKGDKAATQDNPWLGGVGGMAEEKEARKKRKRNKKKEKKVKQKEEQEEIGMRQSSVAFAGVGGAEAFEFEKMKEEEVESSMPTGKSLQAEILPGWGRWDGAGLRGKKRSESTFEKAARERLTEARSVAGKRRRDYGMRHVILDEKRAKRMTELTLGSVPFPFASREEWEREVGGVPVCKELMGNRAFEGVVKSRVVRKLGVAIGPIRVGKTEEKRGDGKKDVLNLRKVKAGKRSAQRKGLMS